MIKWDGNQWINIPLPYSGKINVISEYQGNLCVAGMFRDSNLVLHRLLISNGSQWHPIGNDIQGNNVGIDDMLVYKNELYVAGFFSMNSGNVSNSIARWDGNQWKDLGKGLTYFNGNNGEAFSLCIFDNKLYVGGIFDKADNINASNIALWDGNSWCSSGSHFDNTIGSIVNWRDSLFIGGGFWNIDSSNIEKIAKWDGGNYIDTCIQIIGIDELSRNKIKIFPVPANNLLHVESLDDPLLAITVFDLLGNKISSYNINKLSNKTYIDISFLSDGIYFISIDVVKGRINRKFIKG